MRRLTRRVNIFTKYFMNESIIISFIFMSTLYIVVTIIVYLDDNSKFKIINVLVTGMVFEFSLYQSFGILLLGVSMWYGCSL